MQRSRLSAFLVIVIGVPAITLAFSACGAPDPSQDGSATDPRVGWVTVDRPWGVHKRCDGTTLVYNLSRGGAVIPNSPECAP